MKTTTRGCIAPVVSIPDIRLFVYTLLDNHRNFYKLTLVEALPGEVTEQMTEVG